MEDERGKVDRGVRRVKKSKKTKLKEKRN